MKVTVSLPKEKCVWKGHIKTYVYLFNLFSEPLEIYRTKEQLYRTNQLLKTLVNTLKNYFFDPYVSCQWETYIFQLCICELLVGNQRISLEVVKKHRILEI